MGWQGSFDTQAAEFALFLYLDAASSLFKSWWVQLLLSFEVLSLLLWFMSRLWEQNLWG